MRRQKLINLQRTRRVHRVRKRVRGNSERPRLSVYRSHRNIACQIIDDSQGLTLVSVSTEEKELKPTLAYGGNQAAAQTVGKVLAERALAKGIKAVSFDRGHHKYHGRLAALANAAREGGLNL